MRPRAPAAAHARQADLVSSCTDRATEQPCFPPYRSASRRCGGRPCSRLSCVGSPPSIASEGKAGARVGARKTWCRTAIARRLTSPAAQLPRAPRGSARRRSSENCFVCMTQCAGSQSEADQLASRSGLPGRSVPAYGADLRDSAVRRGPVELAGRATPVRAQLVVAFPVTRPLGVEVTGSVEEQSRGERQSDTPGPRPLRVRRSRPSALPLASESGSGGCLV
jgi:hypothetical protein